MNFKKAALFLFLTIPALPTITHATPTPSHRAVSPVKHLSAGIFDRIRSMGRQKPAVPSASRDNHDNHKVLTAKAR
jgi:hypothetical protein